MPLFSVEVTFDRVVYAKDLSHASDVARTYAVAGMRDLSPQDLGYDIKPFDPKAPLRGMKTGDCYAYGEANLPIKQILAQETCK